MSLSLPLNYRYQMSRARSSDPRPDYGNGNPVFPTRLKIPSFSDPVNLHLELEQAPTARTGIRVVSAMGTASLASARRRPCASVKARYVSLVRDYFKPSCGDRNFVAANGVDEFEPISSAASFSPTGGLSTS